MLSNNLLGQVPQTKTQAASDWISEKNDMAGCDSRCLVPRLPFPALSFIGLKKWQVKGASHGFSLPAPLPKMGFSYSFNISDCLDNSFPMQVSFVLDFKSCHHDLSGFHNEQLLHFRLELVFMQSFFNLNDCMMILWSCKMLTSAWHQQWIPEWHFKIY